MSNKLISYDNAMEIIKGEIKRLSPRTEEIDLLNSLNYILAEDVIADIDMPPFDNSAMDGYAIKFSDRKNWEIIGEISAGNYSSLTLSEGGAVLITTGSKIPPEADTVIPIEDVETSGNALVLKPNAHFKKGMNIRTKGNDLEKGKITVSNFTKIGPNVIAALASCGKIKVKVYNKLKIAVLSTGDELIPINQVPHDDKIRASNNYSLSAAITEINHLPVNLGFAKDDKEIIRRKMKDALEMDIDMLITTGGVSVGKYDYLLELFDEAGIKKKFWRVNIKPGKPIYFGVYEKDKKKILVFGLPGNPVSSLVNFYIFIKPAVDYLYHQNEINFHTAILQHDLKKTDTKRHFSRGIIFYEEDEWRVKAEFSQSSGNLIETSRANCLIEIEENKINPLKGEKVKCIMI